MGLSRKPYCQNGTLDLIKGRFTCKNILRIEMKMISKLFVLFENRIKGFFEG